MANALDRPAHSARREDRKVEVVDESGGAHSSRGNRRFPREINLGPVLEETRTSRNARAAKEDRSPREAALAVLLAFVSAPSEEQRHLGALDSGHCHRRRLEAPGRQAAVSVFLSTQSPDDGGHHRSECSPGSAHGRFREADASFHSPRGDLQDHARCWPAVRPIAVGEPWPSEFFPAVESRLKALQAEYERAVGLATAGQSPGPVS